MARWAFSRNKTPARYSFQLVLGIWALYLSVPDSVRDVPKVFWGPVFPIFCIAKPLHFHLVGCFASSSVSNLVSKVSDMDKLVSCMPVDSGALELEGLDMKTLQISSQLTILEDLLSLPSPQPHLQDYLNFFFTLSSSHHIIISSHHASRRIRLPRSQSNTVCFHTSVVK